MTTAAVSMVKDEADVIAGTIRHMADEVDFIIVADNGSTDGTRDILEELARDLPLTVRHDDDVAYHQSEKMSHLATVAAGRGADWIVPFDADEIWYGHHRISEVLAACTGDVVQVDLYNHFATAVDPAGDDPFDTMIWRQPDPGALPKVAFRWQPGATIHQGNHGVTLIDWHYEATRLAIRHFPYRSVAQMVRKARNGAAAYRATDLPAHVGAHWRSYGDILDRFGPEGIADVFREHFWFLSPTDHGMIPDPAPYMRWRR